METPDSRARRMPVLLSLAFLACLLALPTRAEAQSLTPEQRAAATAAFNAGARKYDLGRFDEAVVEFEKAYEITGDPTILYNIAKSYQYLGKPDRAVFFYKRFLMKTDSASKRAEVQARIAELTAALERLESGNKIPPTGIERNPSTIGTNDPKGRNPTTTSTTTTPTTTTTDPKTTVAMTTTEPKTTKTPPGPSTTTEPKTTTEPNTTESTTTTTTTPSTTATTTATAPAPGPDRRPLLRGLGYGLAGLAVVGLAVGGAMAGLAASAQSDFERRASSGMEYYAGDLQSTYLRGGGYSNGAIAGFVVGGVAAVGAAACLALGFKKRPTTAASITPSVGSNHASLAVMGSF